MSLFSFLWEAMVFSFILVSFFPLRFSFLSLFFRFLFSSSRLFSSITTFPWIRRCVQVSDPSTWKRERERERREKASERASERANDATSVDDASSCALSPTKKKKTLARKINSPTAARGPVPRRPRRRAARRSHAQAAPRSTEGGGRQRGATPRRPARARRPAAPRRRQGGPPPPSLAARRRGPRDAGPLEGPLGALDSPTIRSAALAPGRGLGGGGARFGGGRGRDQTPDALAAGLSRAAAALAAGSLQPRWLPPPLSAGPRPSRQRGALRGRRTRPWRARRREEKKERRRQQKKRRKEKKKTPPRPQKPSPSRPPPSPSPPPPFLLATPSSPSSPPPEKPLPLALAAEVPVRLARGARASRGTSCPLPRCCPSGPLRLQRRLAVGFLSRLRRPRPRGRDARPRRGRALGRGAGVDPRRRVWRSRCWREGAALAAAAWREAEDAFAAAVGGVGEEDDESEVEGRAAANAAAPPRFRFFFFRCLSAAAAAAAAAPSNEERQQQQVNLSFPALEKTAGLAFGLTLLWLVLGIPPAALFGVFGRARPLSGPRGGEAREAARRWRVGRRADAQGGAPDPPREVPHRRGVDGRAAAG